MLILQNAAVMTMAGRDYAKADIAVENAKIVAIKESITANAADETVDFSGMTIWPGFVDAHCHIGMWGDGMGVEGEDGNESTDPITPHMRAIDGINPFDRCFKEAREGGVTSVVTGPGSANVLGGQFVALKTYGRGVEEMIIKHPAAMKAAFGENPKRVYHEQEKMPMTRMATAALLRETLVEVQEYARKLALGEEDEDKLPERDLKLEALLPVLSGELMLKAHVHRADDILTAIRVAREFDIKLSLEHCTEGYQILDLIKESGAGVVLGPNLCDRSKPELSGLSIEAPKLFHEAGIPFALMTDHPVLPAQYLPVAAAVAVRGGLPEMAAMRAITIDAARIAGIADRVGSLEAGKDADFAVYRGSPLDPRVGTSAVFIGGVRVL